MANHRAGDGDMSTSEANTYRRAADPDYTPKHADPTPPASDRPEVAPDQQGRTFGRG